MNLMDLTLENQKNDDMQLSKLDIAIHQLDVAVRLYLEEDYLSSLTLAGAAEEILGKLSERTGNPIAVDYIIKFHWNDTDPIQNDKDRRKEILEALNQGRNQAKHANNPDETHFEVEQIWPLQMIMRAIPMANALGGRISRQDEMAKWIQDHPEAFQ